MLLFVPFVFALTPQNLQAAGPAAERQLFACAEVGCARRAGARAAYQVALQTYVRTGVADAGLVAAVLKLDRSLYDTLPSVLRETDGDAASWTDRIIGKGAPRSPEHTTPSKTTVAITVLDAFGVPVPSARIRFPMLDQEHRVNVDAGTWEGSVLYASSGESRFFHKGDMVRFEVLAPGYAFQVVQTALTKKRRNNISVSLVPQRFDATPGASAQERGAILGWKEWVVLEDRYRVDPTPAIQAEILRVRRAAALFALEWYRATADPTARAVCLSMHPYGTCGSVVEQ